MTRRRKLRWTALGAVFASVAVVPQALIVLADASVWPAAVAISAAIGIALACLFVHMYKIGRRMGRLEYMSNRTIFLCDSLPRSTDVETLAVLHEIRTCYEEACRLADGLGPKGRELGDVMRKMRAKIDRMYEVQSGSLRRTEANAAEFAEAMRALGRDADGSERREP